MYMLYIEQTSPEGITDYILHACKRKGTINSLRKEADELALKYGFKVGWWYDDGTGIADMRNDEWVPAMWCDPRWKVVVHPR